jgi:hypothetical protein
MLIITYPGVKSRDLKHQQTMNKHTDNLERFEDILNLSDYLKENGYEVIYESEKLNEDDLDSPVRHYLHADFGELIVKSQPRNGESNDHIFEVEFGGAFDDDYVSNAIIVLRAYAREHNESLIEIGAIAGTADYVEPVDSYEAHQRIANLEQDFADFDTTLKAKKFIGFNYTFFD